MLRSAAQHGLAFLLAEGEHLGEDLQVFGVADLGGPQPVGIVAAPHAALGAEGPGDAHAGVVQIKQIQITLGHASIQTTELYLGLRQNLHDAPCDQLGLVGWEG